MGKGAKIKYQVLRKKEVKFGSKKLLSEDDIINVKILVGKYGDNVEEFIKHLD